MARSKRLKAEIERALAQLEAAEGHVALCRRRVERAQYEYCVSLLVDDGLLQWNYASGLLKSKPSRIRFGLSRNCCLPKVRL